MSSDKNAPGGAYRRAARQNPVSDCPLTAAHAAVGGKWKLTLIYWLGREPHHFSGLKRRAASISHNVLTEQLRELEADGILRRDPLGAVPAPVMYHLTAYGRTLLPLVEAVRVWGLGHLERLRTGRGASLPASCAVPLEP
jgi:DNA-binding HxlR family transcriptional regulator